MKRTYTEIQIANQHKFIERKLIKKKRRDRHFKRKYAVPKTKEEILLEYDLDDMKQKQFIKRQLINSGGAVCALCGRQITNMKDCTIDHIRPRSKGGLTVLDNCQLAHKHCNLQKGNDYTTL